MMDPVSATGVAAAVVQFVDYGQRLLSRAHEIYKSPDGCTKREAELLSGLEDLRALAAGARETLDRFPETKGDSAIAGVFGDVEEASGEFDDLLKSIQQRQSLQKDSRSGKMVLKSTRLAWDSMRDESQVTALSRRLDGIRNRGVSFTLLSLWQASKESSEREVEFNKMLNNAVKELQRLDAARGPSGTGPEDLSSFAQTRDTYQDQVITVLNDDNLRATDSIYRDLVQTLWNRRWKPAAQQQDVMAITAAKVLEFRAAVVDGLVSGAFENIDAREGAIPRAYKGTFSWVFRGGPTRWRSFPDWLEGETDTPYWITGKPGSGKSTLMKYILQSPELTKGLERWARGSPVCKTSFYAWIAGSDLQKSLVGFKRTILFQALRANTDLVAVVSPRRWTLLSTLRGCRRQPPWEDWEIEESFEVLLAEFGKTGTRRLAVFIDGLDEFKVPPEKVLDLVSDVCRRGGIKVCVASRQWTEFDDALGRHPMLRMQDVTEQDMISFVRGRLEANRGFSDLNRTFPAGAEALILEVVDKANGVFLWSNLVVRNLSQALSDGDTLTQLRAILRSLPEDIDRLYTAIWESIKGSKWDSAELISLKMAAFPELSYMSLWLAHGGRASSTEAQDLQDLSKDAMAGLRSIMVRRLDSKTRGLLEVTPNNNVEFMHRSALDWVNRPEVWADISSYLPDDFDPSLNLMLAEAIKFPSIEFLRRWPTQTTRPTGKSEAAWYQLCSILRYAPKVTSLSLLKPQAVLVEALDVMNKSLENLWRPGWTYEIESPPLNCSFFGILCAFCFLPYLDAKLTSDPSLLKAESDAGASPLENAIWGHLLVEEAGRVPFEVRKKTVSFLLDRGASAQQLRRGRRAELQDLSRHNRLVKTEEEQEYWSFVWIAVEKKRHRLKGIFFKGGQRSQEQPLGAASTKPKEGVTDSRARKSLFRWRSYFGGH